MLLDKDYILYDIFRGDGKCYAYLGKLWELSGYKNSALIDTYSCSRLVELYKRVIVHEKTDGWKVYSKDFVLNGASGIYERFKIEKNKET